MAANTAKGNIITPAAWVLAVLALALLVLPGPARADAVSVRMTQQKDFGRIVLTWAAPVGHRASLVEGVLNVRFSRPIEADLGAVPRILGKYITGAQVSADGNGLLLNLNGEYAYRSYDSANRIVIEISDPPSQTPLSSLSASTEGGATSSGTQAVSVRSGLHEGFTRVVFDWPEVIEYKAKKEDGSLQLSFSAPATMNFSTLASGRLPFIQGAKKDDTEQGVVFTLNFDTTSRVRHFRIERRVVVDVYAPEAPAPETAEAKPEPEPEPEVEAPKVSEAPASETVTETTAAETTTETPSADAEPTLPPLALTPETPVEVDVPKVTKDVSTAGQEEESLAAVKVLKGDGGTIDLRFDWDEPVAAAVFRRAGHLWIVFDVAQEVNAQALVREAQPVITAAEQIKAPGATVLRLSTADKMNPVVKRSGLSWIFEFAQKPMVPSAPLETIAQPNSPLGARLFITVPEPGEVIAINDPEVGDNFAVVPVIPLGHGIGRIWKYPQLNLLPTMQGVVVQPLGDDIRIRTLREGVEVTSASSLQLSTVTAEQLANVRLEAIVNPDDSQALLKPLVRTLALDKWKREDLRVFVRTRQLMESAIAKARDDKKLEETRYELVRFYFANGFTAETLGVLEVMVAKNPALEDDAEFRLTRGAVSYLMGRYDDAENDLHHESLNETDEGAFWRAALQAGKGDLAGAAYELRRTGSIARPYPRALKMPMATLVAEAVVELGDARQGNSYIEILNLEKPSVSEQNRIDYVAGKLAKLGGDFDKAIGKWEGVMEGKHRPTRALAAVARADLLFELERYSPQDVIEELEKLRFTWRGDDFEFNLLKRLGEMYIQEGMFREGLQSLRQAATHFRSHVNSPDITRLMSDTFQGLYIDGGADQLAPITSIALYDEFRELTPSGEAGDEMIRKLADRLVAVDLLDRAAELLESQVEFRLKDEEKARVGARLALIYLFDNKFNDALRVLDDSAGPDLTESLEMDRILLRSRALMGLDRSNEVLELVKGKADVAYEEVRSGVYWKEQNWALSAKSLVKLSRAYGTRARKPLTERQAFTVLRLAVAYTLDKNEIAVTRLRQAYGPAMAIGNYGKAFNIIAEPPRTEMVDFRSISGILAGVESFRDFMTDYRERLDAGELSELF